MKAAAIPQIYGTDRQSESTSDAVTAHLPPEPEKLVFRQFYLHARCPTRAG